MSLLATPSYSWVNTDMTSSTVYDGPKCQITDLALPTIDFHMAGSNMLSG